MRKPKAESETKPEGESRKPETESRKPKPKAESLKPKAESETNPSPSESLRIGTRLLHRPRGPVDLRAREVNESWGGCFSGAQRPFFEQSSRDLSQP